VKKIASNSSTLWALEWRSAVAFADLLFSLDDRPFDGLKLLEIGAGSGLVGVCAALLGADILITEISTSAVELIRRNLELNGLSNEVRAADWNKLEMFAPASFDLVLGSDVLYQGQYAEAISTLIHHILKDGGLAIIFCPGRGYAERLERLSNAHAGLSAEATYLDQVALSDGTSMAELHVVRIQRGQILKEKLTGISNALERFLQKHQS